MAAIDFLILFHLVLIPICLPLVFFYAQYSSFCVPNPLNEFVACYVSIFFCADSFKTQQDSTQPRETSSSLISHEP